MRTFDEAFQSRIHVALRYQDLTSDAKRQIWIAFLKKAHTNDSMRGLPTAGLRGDELHELGEKKVNGRQIKNVVRTASVLASSRKEELGYAHLIQVLDMMEQFDARCVVQFWFLSSSILLTDNFGRDSNAMYQ